MPIIIHMPPVGNISSLDCSVNNLFPLCHFVWWRHSSFISGLEVWSHVIEIVLSGLLLNFYESVVVLNILVSRILLIEWMVLLSRVDRPYLLAVINRRVIRQFIDLLSSCLLFCSLIHLNNLVFVS